MAISRGAYVCHAYIHDANSLYLTSDTFDDANKASKATCRGAQYSINVVLSSNMLNF